MNQILDFAEQIVRDAGKFLKDYKYSDILKIKDFGEIVTSGDLKVEKFIKERVAVAYPGHAFYSEEEDGIFPVAESVWILDPIDGTKYFSRKVPFFTISLALKQLDKLTMGVVYSPSTDQLFRGALNRGAFFGGEPIYCSEIKDLSDATICVEIPCKDSPPEQLEWAFDKLKILVGSVQRVRIIGLGSLGLCWCARGGFDAYAALGNSPKIWDIAAGQVILKEAGGLMTEANGKIVAGPPRLHDKLIDLLEF